MFRIVIVIDLIWFLFFMPLQVTCIGLSYLLPHNIKMYSEVWAQLLSRIK
jgi:hypothetical protein